MSFIYIASPYSSPFPEVRQERYEAVRDYTADLLINRLWCYSPIVHCHELALSRGLPTDAQFWNEYNYAMISKAEGLFVFMLEGWQKSKGVLAEAEMAKELSIPVTFIEPIGRYEFDGDL